MSANKSASSLPVHSRILVPQLYYRQPVISRLISRYGLTVNITAASLTLGKDSEGWFDLELWGNPEQLASSLSYLHSLGVNLLEIAIADNIRKSENSQPFPNFNQSNSPPLTRTNLSAEISSQTNRLRLQLCILKTYYEKPVISQLVSEYNLTVNITSALLKPDIQEDGWFDLELWGKPQQLRSSLNYLEQLGLPIWLDSSFLYNTNNLIE